MAIVMPAPLSATPVYLGCHILVCDPYLTNRRLLRDTLNSFSCGSVEDCASLHLTRKRMEGGGINLLFLDWSAETDALTFLYAIRQPEHPLRFLPVVLMTSYSGLDQVFAARDAGATEFMLRPWSSQVVESRLRSVVLHPRPFIDDGSFFGPDRRRRRVSFTGAERRLYDGGRSGDRRKGAAYWSGPKRRQGDPSFPSLEQRTSQRH